MARTDRRRREDDNTSPVVALLIKLGSKLLLGVIIVLAVLTLAQCTVKKPEAPSWSTHLVVPVVNRTYTMDELIRKLDQDGLTINDSGDVVFSITEELDTVSLDEDALATDDLSYTVQENLGPVDLEKPVLSPVTVTLSDIGPVGLWFPGDSMLITDTTFTIETGLPPISSFSSATLAYGRLDLTITNELDLTLDNITFDLVDAATSMIIASQTYPSPLPSGTQAVIPINLDGATIPNSMSLIASYHTPTDTIQNASTRYLDHSFAFGDTLQATSATACVPALARIDSTAVSLMESDRVDSAVLASGTLDLTIDNATNLDAEITVTAPDFSYYGHTLAVTTPVAAQSQVTVSVDLSDYALVPTSTTIPQQIQVIASAAIPGSGTDQVAVDQADNFTVAAHIANLTFESVTGLFAAVNAQFDGVSQNLEIPTGLEQVEFTNALITLEIENAIDLPGTIDLLLTGDNGKATAFIGDIAPRGLATAATTSIVNDSVADFLSPLPSHVDISGSVTFGGGSYYGTITRDDFVVGRVTVHAPLEMIINPATVTTDIESEEIDQADIDAVTDHFISGRFVYRLTSHLPIGAHINVFLGSDSLTLFTDPQLRFDSLYMTAAPIGAGGIVIDTAQTVDQEIYLDSVDIQILENPVLYIGQEILLAGSDGRTVKLTADDYLSITGRIEVEYLFDGEF